MVASATPTARFASRTLALLVDRLRARRESVAQCAEALRIEAADALSRRDLSDLYDHDDPSVDSDATTALMLADRAERLLWEVDQALARVTDGTYGYCIDCGGGIPFARLQALPATNRCVGCSQRSSPRTRTPVDRDHPGTNKVGGRALAGFGPAMRQVAR